MKKRALTQLIPTLNNYQKDVIKQAISQRDEVAEKSLTTLRMVLKNPTESPYRKYMADMLFTLAHLEEERSHTMIIQLMYLPENSVEDLLGMTLPKHLPVILYKTAGHNFDPIKRLIQNPKAYLYCRTAAMQALVYAAEDGLVSAKDIRQFFSQLYTGKEANSVDSGFWDDLTNHLLALTPTKSQLKAIKEAVKRGLTAPQYLDQSYTTLLCEDCGITTLS